MAYPKWQLRINVQVRGQAAVLRELRRYGKRAKDLFAEHIYEEGLRTLSVSSHYVPFDTGALLASGEVSRPRRVFKQDMPYEVTVSYGDTKVRYAQAVHERLDVHHEPPTQAKFLERALRENAVGMGARIAAAIRAKLG